MGLSNNTTDCFNRFTKTEAQPGLSTSVSVFSMALDFFFSWLYQLQSTRENIYIDMNADTAKENKERKKNNNINIHTMERNTYTQHWIEYAEANWHTLTRTQTELYQQWTANNIGKSKSIQFGILQRAQQHKNTA